MAGTTVSSKLLFDKNEKKVIFAEAGKDFVDFLFNLLSLPVGTVIKLLKNTAMFGCIGNIYESLENLNEAYMQPNQNKALLLEPFVPTHATNVPQLLPASSSSERKFYTCEDSCAYVTDNPETICEDCEGQMSKELFFLTKNPMTNSTNEGGYVKGLVTYLVTDDLSVSSLSLISGVCLLNKFNIMNFSAIEEKVVEFGIDEGLELLKASMQSNAALTSVFLVKQNKNTGAAKK